MLEIGNKLVNKLVLRVTRNEPSEKDLEVGDIVIGLLYRQIGKAFDMILDWRTFAHGGAFAT